MAFKWPNTYLVEVPASEPEIWFAWHPVRLHTGKIAWLRRVLRCQLKRRDWLHEPGFSRWTYAEVK